MRLRRNTDSPKNFGARPENHPDQRGRARIAASSVAEEMARGKFACARSTVSRSRTTTPKLLVRGLCWNMLCVGRAAGIHFQACSFNHSDIPPCSRDQQLAGQWLSPKHRIVSDLLSRLRMSSPTAALQKPSGRELISRFQGSSRTASGCRLRQTAY